jgi:hypothetical protein
MPLGREGPYPDELKAMEARWRNTAASEECRPFEGKWSRAMQALEVLVLAAVDKFEAPDWALQEVSAALERLNKLEVQSLNEAFNFPPIPHREARRKDRLSLSMICDIEFLLGEGIPLNSSNDRLGAVEIVAGKYAISTKLLESYRTKHRKRYSNRVIKSILDVMPEREKEELRRLVPKHVPRA